MKMDLCELIQYEKTKDAYQMKRMFGDYYRNAEDETYAELAEMESKEYDSVGTTRLPSSIGFLGLLGEFIIGEFGPTRKGKEEED